jgi:hypothetical protein
MALLTIFGVDLRSMLAFRPLIRPVVETDVTWVGGIITPTGIACWGCGCVNINGSELALAIVAEGKTRCQSHCFCELFAQGSRFC